MIVALLLLAATAASAQPLCSPVDGPVSSPVGPRVGQGGYERFHKGADYSVPEGTPVRAMSDGKVVMHYPAPNGFFQGDDVFGGYIVIQHGRGTGEYSAYGHLSRTMVEGGQYVYCGEVIGLSGDTGVSTGPHVHVELWLDPQWVLERQ